MRRSIRPKRAPLKSRCSWDSGHTPASRIKIPNHSDQSKVVSGDCARHPASELVLRVATEYALCPYLSSGNIVSMDSIPSSIIAINNSEDADSGLPALPPSRPPLLPERSDFRDGDAPAADKVAALLANALEASDGSASVAGALVPRICDALLSNHSVKAYSRDFTDFVRHMQARQWPCLSCLNPPGTGRAIVLRLSVPTIPHHLR